MKNLNRAWIVILGLAALALTSCAGLPTPQNPVARAFVAAELASYAPAAEYGYQVIDFSVSDEREDTVADSGVTFQSLTGNIGFQVGRRVVGEQAPPDGAFVGSTEHLRLAGAGSVKLTEPATVLGMHITLTSGDLRDYRWIESGREAPLLITGFNRRGEQTGTVRVTPASALLGPVSVMKTWNWVDLTVLGEVTRLDIAFESPLHELPVLLVDNFTFSADFHPDREYFSLALLPDVSEYTGGDDEAFRAQIAYLSALAGSPDSPLVYVTHAGGLVPEGADEEVWEAASDTLLPLDRAVEHGLTFSASELEDRDDPALGSPFFEEFFPPERIQGRTSDSALAEDGYSWYKFVEVPSGRILFIHLMIDAPGETLQWAAQILDANRETPAVVVTPRYLAANTGGDGFSRTTEPVLSGPVGAEVPWIGHSGEQIWSELIWPNPQIFLVVSGDGGGEATTIAWNRADKPVVQMLVDYYDRPEGGEGYLRLLRYYPGRNELRVLTYSPYLDTWEQDPDSYFSLPLDISGRLGLE